jgi:glutamyl/glutaminyl-tRNA synthetase
MAMDGKKLSKRNGDVSVESYLEKGYLTEALINYLALLGWNPKTTEEIFSMEELIERFEPKNINKS